MTTNLTHGDHITTTITRPAHGGVGIGDLDGRVVFVRGTYPGDVVEACITQVKKNYAKATLVDIVTPSPLRVPNRCPAAAHGAGCCDFADLKPEAELELKTTILTGQLTKLGKLAALPPITAQELPPTTGWRSRIRLGVDRAGRAGFRKAHSATAPTVSWGQTPSIVSPPVRKSSRSSMTTAPGTWWKSANPPGGAAAKSSPR